MPYFSTEQDWMLTTRPNRIPLEECFPKHLAVNSLPAGSATNTLRTESRSSPKRASYKQKGKEKEGAVDKLMNRT
jgi:hypothetical protein